MGLRSVGDFDTDAHGAFKNRQQLLDVTGLGPKTFEQSAGFLRIRGGDNPLDFSGVHPETYPLVEKALGLLKRPADEVIGRSEVLRTLKPVFDRGLPPNVKKSFVMAEDLGLVVADPGQMDQIVVNLVSNAVDAMVMAICCPAHKAFTTRKLGIDVQRVAPGEAVLSLRDVQARSADGQL